jgi:hypothetical protein
MGTRSSRLGVIIHEPKPHDLDDPFDDPFFDPKVRERKAR